MIDMKKLFMFFFTILIFCNSYSQSGPDAILPGEKEIPGWRASGEFKQYSRENFQIVVKDETDLFREFGIRNVISRDYYNFSGKVINIQIFTMSNIFGSYGIFLYKSKGEKVTKEFGNSYYEKEGTYAFWKQYYYILMHSASSGDSISKGFRQMAGLIDSRIKSRGNLPEILSLSNNHAGNPTLIKGPISLSAIYYFSPLDIFRINEGVAFENNDSKEIIFKYTDNNEAVRRFSDAAGILGGMTKFSDFIMVGDYSFAMKDKNGKTLTFKVNDNCLDITIK
jgi:hypothetical protein